MKLNKKLVHVSIGLVFMLCWPLFSSGYQGALLAVLILGVNIIKMLLLGLGILKNEATVKSISRFGDYRELLRGPLYYAATITFACLIYWKSSLISIAAICNLCAGDGRQFGSTELPYNRNKYLAGSIAMATTGFLAFIGEDFDMYMYYFSSFGYVKESLEMVLGFLIIRIHYALLNFELFMKAKVGTFLLFMVLLLDIIVGIFCLALVSHVSILFGSIFLKGKRFSKLI
ncbi:hypothetical protein UlMin_023344 [Ulmus minor]